MSKYTLHTEMTVRVYSTGLLAFHFTTEVKGRALKLKGSQKKKNEKTNKQKMINIVFFNDGSFQLSV